MGKGQTLRDQTGTHWVTLDPGLKPLTNQCCYNQISAAATLWLEGTRAPGPAPDHETGIQALPHPPTQRVTPLTARPIARTVHMVVAAYPAAATPPILFASRWSLLNVVEKSAQALPT